MSLRRPLVRFENTGRAQLISSTSMPRKIRSKSRKGKSSTSSRKPRVIKGRINLRVAGYTGVQKIAPSSLIPFLPVNKLRLAAKKALAASGKKKKVVRRRRKQK